MPDRPNSGQVRKEDFRIDLDKKSCTCPAGQKCRTLETSCGGKAGNGESQQRVGFKFDPAVYTACPLRADSVKAGPGKGRTVSVRSREKLLQG